MIKVFLISVILFNLFTASPQARELNVIKKSNEFTCGVVNSLKGISHKDKNNNWNGFFPDICKAISLAIFDDEKRVKFVELTDVELPTALKEEKIDVLSAPLPITFKNGTVNEIAFSLPVYFDNISFIAKKDLNISRLSNAKNAKLCSYKGFPFEERLEDYITSFNNGIVIDKYESLDEATNNFREGKCDILTGNSIYLKIIAKNSDFSILADELLDISYGIGVKDTDEDLLKVASWAFYSMVIAANMKIDSKNIDHMLSSDNADVKTFVNNPSGLAMGLSSKWLFNIIKNIGNYNELYSRNLGAKSEYKLESKYNRLWKDGGSIFAPLLN